MLELNEENFNKEVIESNVPVLVGFWRQGCGSCAPIFSLMEDVKKDIGLKAKVGTLNVLENPETARKHKVPAVPTLIIFHNGESKERAVGLRSKETLIEKIESL